MKITKINEQSYHPLQLQLSIVCVFPLLRSKILITILLSSPPTNQRFRLLHQASGKTEKKSFCYPETQALGNLREIRKEKGERKEVERQHRKYFLLQNVNIFIFFIFFCLVIFFLKYKSPTSLSHHLSVCLAIQERKSNFLPHDRKRESSISEFEE